MDKYISVITNFGCHYTCPYCIVRNNNLHIPKSTVEGLDNLEKEIRRNNCKWISLSGGGDPLWNFKYNLEWYAKFYMIALRTHMHTEVHTSITSIPKEISFDRVVYHLHDLKQLQFIKRNHDE